MIKNLIFDLDNTLYPASSGLDKEMERRMTEFIANYLDLDILEAAKERKRGYESYGTTFSWLIQEKGFTNLSDFLEQVHPKNISDFIAPDHRLEHCLKNISLPKIILTNSPMSHAQRVLDVLAISHHFDAIFDLEYNDYIGKPNSSAYTKALDEFGWESSETLFIDDVPPYLDGFRALGGKCLLVDENMAHSQTSYDRISDLAELPRYLGLI